MVTGAGNLSCQHVIHSSNAVGHADAVHGALLETEKRLLNSVAFPALGTGRSMFVLVIYLMS